MTKHSKQVHLKNMETLRICTVDVKSVLSLRNDISIDKVNDIKPYLEGILGSTFNLLVDVIWSQPINYTISIASSFGTDGCQGMIAKNQSDVSIALVDFPVNEDYEKVNPIVRFMEEPLFILQAYNRTHRRQLADIVKQSFQAFSISLWMSIVCFVLFMGIFLKIREKVLQHEGPSLRLRRDLWLGRRKPWKQNTSYPFFESFSFFIQHDSNDFSDATRRIITLTISISSFVIITGYFCNLMATDMVVVDKPDVMNTYDDILSRPGVISLFGKLVSEYEHFRDADKDSKQYKLWKVMTTERSTEDEILMDPKEMSGITSHFFKATNGLNVLIGSRGFESGARTTFCRLKQVLGNFPDLMTYAPVDPDSPRYGKGMIFRQTNIAFLFTAAKRARRAVEAGYGVIMKKEWDESTLSFDVGDTKVHSDDFRDCMSPTLVMDKPEYQAAYPENYRSLTIFLAVSLLIPLEILLMENIYFFWK